MPVSTTPTASTQVQIIVRRPNAKLGDVVFDPCPAAEAAEDLRLYLESEGANEDTARWARVGKLLDAWRFEEAFRLARVGVAEGEFVEVRMRE